MDTEIIALEKTCSRCQVTQPTANFTKDGKRKDGLYSRCKSCKNAGTRRSRENNPETYRASNKASREKRITSGLCVRCGNASERGTQECYECMKRLSLKKRPHRKFAAPCVFCGFEYSDVHHKDGNHKNNAADNLVPLCPNHHRLVHMGLLELV